MTQDKIIRIAQGYEPTFTWQQLQAAVLAEREACAKMCEEMWAGGYGPSAITAAIRERSANARARGDKE